MGALYLQVSIYQVTIQIYSHQYKETAQMLLCQENIKIVKSHFGGLDVCIFLCSKCSIILITLLHIFHIYVQMSFKAHLNIDMKNV